MVTLYGIKNCDTVRKARRWLEEHDVDYRFHDFRADGLDEPAVREWLSQLGWETLVNRRSTSWKALAPEVREAMDDASALREILATPTLIKRPLLARNDELAVGFDGGRYAALFAG